MAALPLDWRRVALRGCIAGLTGGALFGAFLWAIGPLYAGMVNFGEFIILYVALSLAWGIGYVYLADTRPQINKLPLLSGVVFGIVVYVVMQLVLYGVAAEQTHTALQVAYGVIASCLFFGLPIALLTRLFESAR